MQKTTINTIDAPQAIGAYSQATRLGELVFVSGQIPLDPASGQMIDGPIEAQIEQVIANLRAVCVAGGATLDSILKLTVFLADMNDFAAVNEVMSCHFQEPYPARAAVEVAALPKGARVEMDAIATVTK